MVHSDGSSQGTETTVRRTISSLALIALLAFAACAMAFAQNTSPIKASFHLTATELDFDEGEVVEFFLKDKEYLHPQTGAPLQFEADLSPVTWDFNDAKTGPAEDYGLYHVRQWFSNDDGGKSRVVKATHQGTTKEIEVRVRNVLPLVHGVYMTQKPRSGEPTVFQAIVRDPGFDDEISFEWNFGDGATATGPNVIHNYASKGDYEVTLKVADEEGREDESKAQSGSFTVTIDAAQDKDAENTISVTGDVTESKAEFTGITVLGSNGNPMNPKAGGACEVRLEMRTDRDDMLLTLTARLDRGLAPGHYTIGNTREWDGSHRDERAAQGTFFADFSPPRDLANRIIDGLTIGGPFWSDSGRVSINRFDSGVLELDFEATLTENITASYEPRQVRVSGALSTTVGKAPDLDKARNPSDLGRALGGMLGSSDQGGYNVRAYLCPGEEPKEFELVESAPKANATGALYENAGVSLRFSQVVDSDSIVNAETLRPNLKILVRNNSDGYYTLPGGWVASPDNPTVVQFIPQSRLLPGVIYCIYVNGGEDGVRSFSGNILGGSSLAAPSAEMARACAAPGKDEFGFTFSTRVELQSAWVDIYQASLAGPRAELIKSRPKSARVYTWWQDALNIIHPTAQVREFEANVSAFSNGALMDPPDESVSSPQRVTIKRPDLYSASELTSMAHTPRFSVGTTHGDIEVEAAIQMKDENGQLLLPEFRSPPERYSVRKPEGQNLVIYTMKMEGVCAAGLTRQQCRWGGPWNEDWITQADIAHKRISGVAEKQLPVDYVDVRSGAVQRFEIERPCPEGVSDADCRATRLQALAEQVARRFLDGPDYDPRVAIILAFAPHGLIPNAGSRAAVLFENAFPAPDVIFTQVDLVNLVGLTHYFVRALLGNDACMFSPTSFCDSTPVQGMRRGQYGGWYNKHHVEGNEESNNLDPLMSFAAYNHYNEKDFHISAYNWGKLYEAIKQRHDHANGGSPDS